MIVDYTAYPNWSVPSHFGRDDRASSPEAAYAQTHKDLPVGIYLAAGTLEATDPQLEGIGEIVNGMTHRGRGGRVCSPSLPSLGSSSFHS